MKTTGSSAWSTSTAAFGPEEVPRCAVETSPQSGGAAGGYRLGAGLSSMLRLQHRPQLLVTESPPAASVGQPSTPAARRGRYDLTQHPAPVSIRRFAPCSGSADDAVSRATGNVAGRVTGSRTRLDRWPVRLSGSPSGYLFVFGNAHRLARITGTTTRATAASSSTAPMANRMTAIQARSGMVAPTSAITDTPAVPSGFITTTSH
jgi:hypothetical protein